MLKNALDWASRPLATNPLRNKPVAVIGASTGMFGAVWAQAELRKVLGAAGARVTEVELAVGHAHEHLDPAGTRPIRPRRKPCVTRLACFLAAGERGGGRLDGDVDVRARPHRGRVPGSAHDGQLGPGAVQGHPRGARARLGPLPGRHLRGRDRRDRLWTGEPARDAHLRSADFFDVEHHPKISFSGRFSERTAETAFKGEVELTIRGVTRTLPLDIAYIGEWKTPWWEGGENKGEMRRIGFQATARIDRHDFGVSWQDELPDGGLVVSNEIELVLDVEAILLDDLERTGAIEYYRTAEPAPVAALDYARSRAV